MRICAVHSKRPTGKNCVVKAFSTKVLCFAFGSSSLAADVSTSLSTATAIVYGYASETLFYWICQQIKFQPKQSVVRYGLRTQFSRNHFFPLSRSGCTCSLYASKTCASALRWLSLSSVVGSRRSSVVS